MNRLKWVWNQALRHKVPSGDGDVPLLVWGTGTYGEEFTKMLNEMRLAPLAYVDSNTNKQGGIFHNKRILEPEDALAKYAEAKIILAMSDRYANDVRERLLAQGRNCCGCREFILSRLKDCKILEIGPLHNPFFKGDNVKYLDVLNAEGLLAKAKFHGLPTGNVPKHIDYVSPDGSWEGIEEKFDLIYGSHLLEHQTDLVKHLRDVERHVHLGGAYVLVVPDKRYCFNFYDPCTKLEEVLAAYYERRKRHSLATLIRAVCATHNDVRLHWQGEHGTPGVLSTEALTKVVDEYRASMSGDYIDAHAWYFTPESLVDILQELKRLGLVSFKSLALANTVKGTNVFYVCVRY